jgi:outer membrane lipoprotein-sorting protein
MVNTFCNTLSTQMVQEAEVQQKMQELKRQYEGQTFGLGIDDNTFDFFLPKNLDKVKNRELYLDWKA